MEPALHPSPESSRIKSPTQQRTATPPKQHGLTQSACTSSKRLTSQYTAKQTKVKACRKVLDSDQALSPPRNRMTPMKKWRLGPRKEHMLSQIREWPQGLCERNHSSPTTPSIEPPLLVKSTPDPCRMATRPLATMTTPQPLTQINICTALHITGSFQRSILDEQPPHADGSAVGPQAHNPHHSWVRFDDAVVADVYGYVPMPKDQITTLPLSQ